MLLHSFIALAALWLPSFTSGIYTPPHLAYKWKNVKIGGGGGFVPGIIFNPTQQGLAYLRTDIGGAYRLNPDDTWTPLLDFANATHWNYWGTDAIATDPVDPKNLYIATGLYTNSWDPNDGQILVSRDYGNTFTASLLPFKVGGNMPGRGLGERLAVDPNDNSIIYFGARSGHGLWKSTDSGHTWKNVTSFPSVGSLIPDPTDTSGYNSDIIGLAWITFDTTSILHPGSHGPTPRIFVGVADQGKDNVFVSSDAGVTWSALAGQDNTYVPHKGVLSPKEKLLYISYGQGAGPSDGSAGNVKKYNLTSGAWTDITPEVGTFGFGGLSIDLQKPGVVMVAALNEWWPDVNIWRSNNSGASWTPLWAWDGPYPYMDHFYGFDSSLAPWIGGPIDNTDVNVKRIGWWVETLNIDPHDSNHWLYATGLTVFGGHDLLKWDSVHNVTIKSLADGVEEEAVQDLCSPPTGAHLISAVGDDGGFVHKNLDQPPLNMFQNPIWTTTASLDYAGQKPSTIVRLGSNYDGTSQVALSWDGGNTWASDPGASNGLAGGSIAISALGDTVLWSSSDGVLTSFNQSTFTSVPTLPNGAIIASDKVNNSIFYAASSSKFYLSTDGGKTFTFASTIGTTTSPSKIVANLLEKGDVWVSSDTGIYHSSFGNIWKKVSTVDQAWGIALGAPPPGVRNADPGLFAYASIDGTQGVYASPDAGTSWFRIDDAAHGFATGSGLIVEADPRVYGRVYLGTNGRGIFYGDVLA